MLVLEPDDGSNGPVGTDSVQAQVSWFPFGGWSPANCYADATHAHPSSSQPGTIGYHVDVKCDRPVSKIAIEVWGDRSSWSGWRQHTDGHKFKSVRNEQELGSGQHMTGLEGYYNYRTRGIGWSVENGLTYSRSFTGDSKRIVCSTSACAWA